jgi:DNA replication and repair protein RecF
MAGIHKDDIVFLLNDKPVYEIASQGQKRSFLLALKLGLADIIKDKSYQYPILLLDDVFSELDNERKRSLIQNLPDSMQIFITTTEPVKKEWFMNRSYHLHMVENGMIREAF